MEKNSQTRYDSFEGFIKEILEERSRQGKPVDSLLAAVAAILGPSALSSITRALNITGGITLSAGLTAALPILGAVAGAVTGMLLAKYLAKAHSQEGITATQILKKAETLYRDYSSSSLSETDKKELINDLFDDVLAEKEPIG
ncbi:MAG: hypothetical protein AB7S77_00915 [Desulfatirhabdiaceae bacterium]